MVEANTEDKEAMTTRPTPPASAAAGEAIPQWIRGRVVSIYSDALVVVSLGGTEHVISRDQAVALGTRLLEVGIGTSFADEREINAQIGDLVCEATKRMRGGNP